MNTCGSLGVMNTDLLARTTFVLDRTTHEQLSYVAKRMGVSRSELVRDVLVEPVALMAKWAASLPENPTPADAERVTGELQGDLVEFIERHKGEAGL
jgi:hypothetical protein